MPRTPLPRRATAVVLLAAALAGCQSPYRVVEPGGVPPDFSVDLQVLAAEETAERPDAVARRPARYLVLADGTLLAAVGETPRDAPVPRRRVLSRAEFVDLWELVNTLGLTDETTVSAVGNPALLEVVPGQVTFVAVVTANGEYLTFGRTLGPADPADHRLVRLARHLARLAWVPEEDDARVGVVPHRYDLGPDPHARYRERETPE